ncbi:MAG TPA: restriction endonuclease [Candidatus Dormibacteraeota bacterium]|nr:restriction endonuclease [Candidatus Dormibacteraeota bacterium]
MPRRPRSRSNGDLFDLAEEFKDYPLWLALAAAGGVVVILELIIPAAVHSNPSKSPAGVDYAALFLPLLQWIGWLFAAAIVVFGLIGAGTRWLDRKADGARYRSQTGIDSVRRLSWPAFERLIHEAYRQQGYEVIPRGGPHADGGVDLEIRKNGERLLVQAKHWKSYKVRLPQVRDLWGAVAHEHADGAVLVTSGAFTPDAWAWVNGKNFELVDGNRLTHLIPHVDQAAVSTPQPARACPKCGRPLVQRIARRGQHAGEPFWGCSGYPDCRYIDGV